MVHSNSVKTTLALVILSLALAITAIHAQPLTNVMAPLADSDARELIATSNYGSVINSSSRFSVINSFTRRSL